MRLVFMHIESIDLDKHHTQLFYNFDMRKEDYEELLAQTGNNPFETLIKCIVETRHPLCVMHDDKMLAAFGVCDILFYDYESDRLVNTMLGRPWLITANGIEKYPLFMVKNARMLFKNEFSNYTGYFNFVDSRYAKSIKFLEKVGFTVERECIVNFYDKSVDFYMFHMLKPGLKYKDLNDYVNAKKEVT